MYLGKKEKCSLTGLYTAKVEKWWKKNGKTSWRQIYIACQDEECALNLENEQQMKIVLNRKMMWYDWWLEKRLTWQEDSFKLGKAEE